MEQPFSSLNLSNDKYKFLKSLGFNHINETQEDTKVNFFNTKEFQTLTTVPKIKTALDFYHENNESGTIYTFNKELDKLLENEMITGNIVEICGEPGSGKTQICFQLCINVQLPKWLGGKDGGAMYLCTNYNFSSERLRGQQIANKISSMNFTNEDKLLLNNFTVDNILRNIHHLQINTYDEFLAFNIYLKKFLKNNKIRLLVIDCITFIIQQIGYKEKRQFVYRIFNELQRLANEFDFVIIVTNNITYRAKSIDQIYKTASLGEAYYHRINTRIMLKRLTDNCFKASLDKSVTKKESAVLFQF